MKKMWESFQRTFDEMNKLEVVLTAWTLAAALGGIFIGDWHLTILQLFIFAVFIKDVTQRIIVKTYKASIDYQTRAYEDLIDLTKKLIVQLRVQGSDEFVDARLAEFKQKRGHHKAKPPEDTPRTKGGNSFQPVENPA